MPCHLSGIKILYMPDLYEDITWNGLCSKLTACQIVLIHPRINISRKYIANPNAQLTDLDLLILLRHAPDANQYTTK